MSNLLNDKETNSFSMVSGITLKNLLLCGDDKFDDTKNLKIY